MPEIRTAATLGAAEPPIQIANPTEETQTSRVSTQIWSPDREAIPTNQGVPMPTWCLDLADEESEEEISPTPPQEVRSPTPPRELVDDATGASQREFAREVKTCAKRKGAYQCRGKADEASKRSRLSSDPERYLLGLVSRAETIFGRSRFAVPDEPVSPIFARDETSEEANPPDSGYIQEGSGVEEMSTSPPTSPIVASEDVESGAPIPSNEEGRVSPVHLEDQSGSLSHSLTPAQAEGCPLIAPSLGLARETSNQPAPNVASPSSSASSIVGLGASGRVVPIRSLRDCPDVLWRLLLQSSPKVSCGMPGELLLRGLPTLSFIPNFR